MGQILERPLAPTRHRLNVDAYYRMAEAGILTDPHRVELIDGEIIDMAAIGSPHAAITNRLARLFTRAFSDEVALVSVQSPLRLDAYNEPEPDLMLLRPRPDGYRAGHPGAADVLLLIEVSESSLAYDRSTKLTLYARFRRSGGLDRRSLRRRGRSLSRAQGGRLCVAPAADRRTARPGARPGGDDRCRRAHRVTASPFDQALPRPAEAEALLSGIARQEAAGGAVSRLKHDETTSMH